MVVADFLQSWPMLFVEIDIIKVRLICGNNFIDDGAVPNMLRVKFYLR